jgi:hypothetical protein
MKKIVHRDKRNSTSSLISIYTGRIAKKNTAKLKLIYAENRRKNTALLIFIYSEE